MLHLNTHRVTSLEDCEHWADARQPSRWQHTRAEVHPLEAPAESIIEGERIMKPEQVPPPAADSQQGACGDDWEAAMSSEMEWWIIGVCLVSVACAVLIAVFG